jgi:hypothetical protein
MPACPRTRQQVIRFSYLSARLDSALGKPFLFKLAWRVCAILALKFEGLIHADRC